MMAIWSTFGPERAFRSLDKVRWPFLHRRDRDLFIPVLMSICRGSTSFSGAASASTKVLFLIVRFSGDLPSFTRRLSSSSCLDNDFLLLEPLIAFCNFVVGRSRDFSVGRKGTRPNRLETPEMIRCICNSCTCTLRCFTVVMTDEHVFEFCIRTLEFSVSLGVLCVSQTKSSRVNCCFCSCMCFAF
jgi:hypothetical protein